MKKLLPLVLLFIGILVVVGVFIFVKVSGGKTENTEDDEASLIEVPLAQRPVASLTPTSDGHYLKLNLSKVVIPAASLDYELLYQTEEGLTQGVPGSVDLRAKDTFETDLLLGSESSGKFRYDEGVNSGSLSLKFRNDKGKLIAKFSSDFRLFSAEKSLKSTDGSFSIELTATPKKGYFVVMDTFGIPDSAPVAVASGPYGFFPSEDSVFEGTVEIVNLRVFMHVSGPRWEEITSETKLDSETGVFIGASK